MASQLLIIKVKVNSLAILLSIDIVVSVKSFLTVMMHTTYTRNDMGKKCEGNCGLWVLNEIYFFKYPENLGAVWELLAKQHSQSSPI